jgi:hypothetical protein
MEQQSGFYLIIKSIGIGEKNKGESEGDFSAKTNLFFENRTKRICQKYRKWSYRSAKQRYMGNNLKDIPYCSNYTRDCTE